MQKQIKGEEMFNLREVVLNVVYQVVEMDMIKNKIRVDAAELFKHYKHF